MNPKIARIAAKIGVGVVGTLAIGLVVRAERAVDDRIDARFDEKASEETPENV